MKETQGFASRASLWVDGGCWPPGISKELRSELGGVGAAAEGDLDDVDTIGMYDDQLA